MFLRLDSDWLMRADPFWKELQLQRLNRSVLNFTFLAYFQEFRTVQTELPMPRPQMRHSNDVAMKRRCSAEVQARRQWEGSNNLHRYEKHASLEVTWHTLKPKERKLFEDRELLLKDLLNRQAVGLDLVRLQGLKVWVATSPMSSAKEFLSGGTA